MKNFVFCLMTSCLLIVSAAAQELKIFTEEDPPYNFVGAEGKPAGFAVDLLAEMQKRMKTAVPVSIVPWARGYHYVQHDPNVVLFTMGRTPEREALFQWVGPLIVNDWVLIMRRSDKLHVSSLEQAAALESIGVVRDFASHRYLEEKGFSNLQPVTRNLRNVLKLKAGHIQAYVSTNNNYLAEIEEAGLDPADFVTVLTIKSVALYYAFSKGSDQGLIHLWQKTLDGMKADGSYHRILSVWFPGQKISKRK